MTRPELRVFLQGWFCGCGQPELSARALRDLLACHPLYDHRAEIDHLLPEYGMQQLMLYTLDHFDLIEHGGGIGGAWLSKKGQAVLEALQREEGDAFEALSAMCCVHGYAVESELEDCQECK